MAACGCNLFIAAAILCCLYAADAKRTKKKIYVDVSGISACFRRMNATHQFGCTSAEAGNVGVVHFLEAEEDYEWVLNRGPHAPYVVLMGPEHFNKTNLLRLKNSGRINGMMVIHTVDNETLTPLPEEGFSADSTCPLDSYGLYSNQSNYSNCQKQVWNPYGTDLMYQDFSLPIFILTNDTEVDYIIKECYERFNKPTSNGSRSYPLCAAELKDRMNAAKDSVTCIRRTEHISNLNPDSYCDALGDQNIFGTVKAVPSNSSYPENSVIVAAARMDSMSLFDGISPSADNHVTGIVGLLAAAEALSKVKDMIINQVDSKDILFTFFQGEAFDYIGSSRMVYEMEKDRFPSAAEDKEVHLHQINLTHISHFVEVNQLGHRDEGKLWIHSDPISRQTESISSEVNRMVEEIKKVGNSSSIAIEESDSDLPLPPASAQRFLMKKAIPTVVITDHKAEFTNKYYNSRFDLAQTIKASYPAELNETERYDYVTTQAAMLTDVSTMLARFLYTLSTKDSSPDVLAEIVANETSITHMLYCFLLKPQCELFREIIAPSTAEDLEKATAPYPFYVGVDSTTNAVTHLTKRLLSLYTGDLIVNKTKDNCKSSNEKFKVYQYVWMQGPLPDRKGMCIKSTVDLSTAASPAFADKDIYGDYDWSGDYSTWTESVWPTDTMTIRIFLVPSKELETMTLSLGVIVLLVSFIVIYFINDKADMLFSTSRHSSYY